MLSHFVAVCLALLPFAQCMQIHQHMTKEEVSNIFQSGHDNVPSYEVVRIYHTLHKRDLEADLIRMIQLNTRDGNLSLPLRRNKELLVGELTPVWTVVEHVGFPNGTKYMRDREVLVDIGRAYHNIWKRSAVVAYEGEDGETLIHGTLLENLIVRPLPYRLHNTIQRERRDLVDLLPDGVEGNTDFRRSHYHVVFKRSERDMKATHDGITIVERERRNVPSSTSNQTKAGIPEIVYPQILIIVDFNLYKAIGKSVNDAVRYVLAFWNGIDLRYRLMERPNVRLMIAGIIISLAPRGTPYLKNVGKSSTMIDADLSLEAMSRYFYTESYTFPFDSYDIAVAMTQLDICKTRSNGHFNRRPRSFTYRAGACARNHTKMINYAMAIVEDNGGFSGTLVTTRNVAHLMGVPSDGSAKSSACPATDNYIMAPCKYHGENTFEWSMCSLIHLSDFLSSPRSTCLHNYPPIRRAIRRKLPGELLTVHDQCRKIRGTLSCYTDERVCSALACYRPGNYSICDVIQNAAEGTSCGFDKYCLDGHCVNKGMRHIPNGHVN